MLRSQLEYRPYRAFEVLYFPPHLLLFLLTLC